MTASSSTCPPPAAPRSSLPVTLQIGEYLLVPATGHPHDLDGPRVLGDDLAASDSSIVLLGVVLHKIGAAALRARHDTYQQVRDILQDAAEPFETIIRAASDAYKRALEQRLLIHEYLQCAETVTVGQRIAEKLQIPDNVEHIVAEFKELAKEGQRPHRRHRGEHPPAPQPKERKMPAKEPTPPAADPDPPTNQLSADPPTNDAPTEPTTPTRAAPTAPSDTFADTPSTKQRSRGLGRRGNIVGHSDIVAGKPYTRTPTNTADTTATSPKRRPRSLTIPPDTAARVEASQMHRADLLLIAADRYADQLQQTPRRKTAGRVRFCVSLNDEEHARLLRIAKRRGWGLSATASALLKLYLAELEENEAARNKTSKRARA